MDVSWRAAVHGATESPTWPRDWATNKKGTWTAKGSWVLPWRGKKLLIPRTLSGPLTKPGSRWYTGEGLDPPFMAGFDDLARALTAIIFVFFFGNTAQCLGAYGCRVCNLLSDSSEKMWCEYTYRKGALMVQKVGTMLVISGSHLSQGLCVFSVSLLMLQFFCN